MARIKVTLDHAAIRGMLRRQFEPVIAEKADEVRAAAQTILDTVYPGEGKTVDTKPGVTDRFRTTVAITEPNGARIEAKYGVIQEAAEGAGLEVRRRD